jgi:hypothetical protein
MANMGSFTTYFTYLTHIISPGANPGANIAANFYPVIYTGNPWERQVVLEKYYPAHLTRFWPRDCGLRGGGHGLSTRRKHIDGDGGT